ncbi:galactokinase [Candidatus Omnitrophota bacterium]
MVDKKTVEAFITSFGTKPDSLIQVPGRVNLIGEHTDYNGLPVLPISIPFTVKAAAAPRSDRAVHIMNSDTAYVSTSFELSDSIPHSQEGNWANYIKAAAQAVVTSAGNNLNGMNTLFHGSIPLSAGLSSSSALVVASALSLLASNKKPIDFKELAELLAVGEHYVGTQGGGMDQAICLLGKKDHAVKIDFFPLRLSYIPFPQDFSIVVAHSLVRAAKTENALLLYNRRPAECRLATAIINAVHTIDPPIQRLGDLMAIPGYQSVLDTAERFVGETFTQNAYSLQKISDITGETTEAVTDKYLMTRSGVPMPVPPEGFLIRQRALHVFSEANRVEKSCKALRDNDVKTFGSFMNESHESCDKQYGLSTPELNELVSIMRNLGAVGARLTGAGFGGCAIALVRDDKVEKVIDSIRETYYNGYIAQHRPGLLKDFTIDEILFAVKPAAGATVSTL